MKMKSLGSTGVLLVQVVFLVLAFAVSTARTTTSYHETNESTSPTPSVYLSIIRPPSNSTGTHSEPSILNLSSGSNETTTIQPRLTTLGPTSHHPIFIPQLCEPDKMARNRVDINATNENAQIHFLPGKSYHVTQEKSSVNIQCRFCVTRSLDWVNIFWYKGGSLIQSGADYIPIRRARHNDEGIYSCKVITPTNQIKLKVITLIVNKDPIFSMIPTVWARNISFTRATKILWQVRGRGLFDAVKVTIKVRQLGNPSWLHKRAYTEFISGSTELNDLQPSTIYIANVSVVSSYGKKAECRSIVFWSNAKNSTDFDRGVLSLDYCTRKLLGLIIGIFGLVFTIGAVFCCCAYPVCEYRNHQGYTSTSQQDVKDDKTNNQDVKNIMEHDEETVLMV